MVFKTVNTKQERKWSLQDRKQTWITLPMPQLTVLRVSIDHRHPERENSGRIQAAGLLEEV